jgi:YD repeat-containing protein
MNKINFLTVAFCLFAGQILAVNSVYLPTVAYRNNEQQKVEYEYDSFGHVLSEKLYDKMGGTEYVLWETYLREYHQLPNGEFVRTKDEHILNNVTDYKMTASYDSKGMQLSFKQEQHGQSGYQTEAIVNTNGIRTGLKVYNNDTGQLETSTFYKFDDKGRVTQAPWDDDDDDNVTVANFTWGNELNELISASLPIGAVFSNFSPLKNLEYFDIYSLNPLEDNKAPEGDMKYVWEDYMLHSMFANIDVLFGGQTGAYTCTIDDSKGEWTQILTIGGVEIEKVVLKKLANGGWTEIYTDDDSEYTTTREYNTYGALTRYYNLGNWYGSEGVEAHEEIYNREYDAQGRPTKTTYLYHNAQQYVETYTEWVVKGTTGIADVAAPKLSVTIAGGKLQIAGYEWQEKDVVSIYDLSGRNVGHSTDVSGLQPGVYIVRVGNQSAKVIKQ